MLQDVWFALRRTRARAVHSIVVALTLGLGIGASLAVFTIVGAVLIRPLPYADAAQLVGVTRKLPIAGFPEIPFSDVGYRRLASDTRTLAATAAYTTRDANLIGRGQPRRLTTARVSASMFDVLRVTPRLGRAFTAEEDLTNGPRVVAISPAWLVLVPFWAIWPFETLIVPRVPAARMPDLPPPARDELAAILRGLVRRYDALFGVPFPYSMGWHGAPFGPGANAHVDAWTLDLGYDAQRRSRGLWPLN